jgi:hypothetical protein
VKDKEPSSSARARTPQLDRQAAVMPRLCSFLALLCIAASPRADQVAQTSPETFVSDYGRYRLTVFPLEYPGAFFGLTHRDLMVSSFPPGHQVKQSTPEAVLEQWVGNTYEVLWRRPLVNAIAPGSVIVSARNGSFATFNDWGQSGYGDNVVVIYSWAGTVVKKFSLRDLMTEEQIQKLPHTIVSIRWGGHHILVDDDSMLLLRVGIDGEWSEDKRQYRDVKVRMRDGALLE